MVISLVALLYRFVALLNASLWLGAGTFLTLGVGPTLFSKTLAESITRQQAGTVAQLILAKYFLFQGITAAIACLISLKAKPLGWRLPRFAMPLTVALLALVAVGGGWLQPKLHDLNARRYAPATPPELKLQLSAQFGAWHGVSQLGNLLVLVGVLAHFLQQIPPQPHPYRSGT